MYTFELSCFLSLFPMAIFAMSGGYSVQSSDKYPFSVTLTNPILCGGSIISLDPPWILTAAHCIENLVVTGTENDYSVAYGDKEFVHQSYAAVKKAVLHPLYTTSSQSLQPQAYAVDGTGSVPYDIGLIQLTSPLVPTSAVNRIPILMDSSSSTRLEAIGMGYTGYQQPHADVLQYTQCKISKTNALPNNNFDHSTVLTTSKAGLCHGDSGSPLLYKNDSSEYVLSGVLNRILNAYDPDPDNISCPLHDTNLTHFINAFVKPSSHIDWIMEVTQLSRIALTQLVATTDSDHNYFLSPTSSASFLWHGFRLHLGGLMLLNLVYIHYMS